MSYSAMLYDNDEVYGNLNPDSYQHIIIAVQNYVTLMKDRKLAEYMDFYNRFYK